MGYIPTCFGKECLLQGAIICFLFKMFLLWNSKFNDGLLLCELEVCLKLSIITSEHTGFVI